MSNGWMITCLRGRSESIRFLSIRIQQTLAILYVLPNDNGFEFVFIANGKYILRLTKTIRLRMACDMSVIVCFLRCVDYVSKVIYTFH